MNLVLGRDKYRSLEQLGSYQPRSVHDGDSIHLSANTENKVQSSSSNAIKIGKFLAKNREFLFSLVPPFRWALKDRYKSKNGDKKIL